MVAFSLQLAHSVIHTLAYIVTSGSEKNDIAIKKRGVRISPASGPVHTNPFSDEYRAVLLRFQKDLRPHLSFSYRFRPFTLQRRIRFETIGSFSNGDGDDGDDVL